MEEGSILTREVPEPHRLLGELVERRPSTLPVRLVLEQHKGQEDPRLQDHVLLLGSHQPVGRIVHKAEDLLAGPHGDVSGIEKLKLKPASVMSLKM